MSYTNRNIDKKRMVKKKVHRNIRDNCTYPPFFLKKESKIVHFLQELKPTLQYII